MPHQGMALCLGACLVIAGCAADAEDVGSPAPLVVQDVIYGHKLGMALVKSRVVCKSERKLLDASVRLPWRPPWAQGVRGPGNGARSRPQ